MAKVRNIGIPAKPPEKVCDDPNCPWHGNISLRGRMFVGKVVSAKAHKTAVVQWDYVHFVPKYERYERRKTKVVAHNPECIHAKEGDIVKIMETRPISKTKTFVIVEVIKRGEE